MTYGSDWQPVIAFAVTFILGLGIDFFLFEFMCKNVKPKPFPPEGPPVSAGRWIGNIERVIFLAALWISGAWPLLVSWFAFKLAIYWQGSSYPALPEKPPGNVEMDYLIAKQYLSRYRATKVLIGTGSNVIVALCGVAAGRWILVC